jgi:hypothetical protein
VPEHALLSEQLNGLCSLHFTHAADAPPGVDHGNGAPL